MAQSVKVNYILNLINTGTQMLFPLITFPYVCRVIEADGIGQINFFQSIISYISLFTCLGIPMYAIREIARDRSDVVQMNRTAMEILLLHSMLIGRIRYRRHPLFDCSADSSQHTIVLDSEPYHLFYGYRL